MYLKLIEYIFCFVFEKYQKWGEKGIPGVYALCFISTLQVFNILTLHLFALILKILDIHQINKYYFVGLSIIFLIFNYLYIYKTKGRDLLLENYSKGGRNMHRIKDSQP